MPSFSDYLSSGSTSFSVTISGCNTDLKSYIKNQLINSPYILSTISAYSYNSVLDYANNQVVANFRVRYDYSKSSFPVYQVRNHLELNTAISLMFRFHSPGIKIVVDNHTGFITQINKYDIIYSAKALADEELQTSQMSRSSVSFTSWFDNSVVVYTMNNSMFDTAKAVNDMSCYAASLAIKIRSSSRNNVQVLDSLKDWFIKNIKYRNNCLTSDHSAVGLIINKTGVCQAISAFAFQVLSFCGLKTRYVHGQGDGNGGWGAHAWNMVYVNNCWTHIDYTFDLYNPQASIVKPLAQFRKNHQWDDVFYSSSSSETYVETRRALDHSLIIAMPDLPCYSVNGCIVDTNNSNPICIKIAGRLYLSIFDIVTISGGCYELKGDAVWIYFDTMYFSIPLRDLCHSQNSWYCPISTVKQLNISVDAIGNKVLIQNKN